MPAERSLVDTRPPRRARWKRPVHRGTQPRGECRGALWASGSSRGLAVWADGVPYIGTTGLQRHSSRDRGGRPSGRGEPSDPQPRSSFGHPGEAIGLLRIPAFGADYEIPILNGTDLSILSKGVGHYASTAAPGQIGNFALAGHRVTHGQPFARLLDLKRGDEVIVETREAIYTYVLDDSPRSLTVRDNDTWVIDPVPGQPDAKPTQPCHADPLPGPVPVGDRSIGFGHLKSTQKSKASLSSRLRPSSRLRQQ